MLRWITQFLKDRKACVSLQGKRSRTGDIKNGVPQGKFLSPTLFLIFMNDVKEQMAKNVQCAGYADDLALVCSEDTVGTAQVRLQSTLNNLFAWSNSWGLKINTTKTTYTLFSLSPKPQKARLTIGGHRLQEEPNPTYLGVKFDPRLTWNVHTEQCRNKGLHRTELLKKLAGSDWEADHAELRKAYVGYARPVLEYSMAAWSTTSDSNFNKICRVQNQNLIIMTGALKSTPINDKETITGLESMGDRREVKQVIQMEKNEKVATSPHERKSNNRNKKPAKKTKFPTQGKKKLATPRNISPRQTRANDHHICYTSVHAEETRDQRLY